MKASLNLLGAATFALGLSLVGWTGLQRAEAPRLQAPEAAHAPPPDCQPGKATFTGAAPPAPPGQWSGNQGFFEIPGTLDLEYCGPGTAHFTARGDVADNGGAPLLVIRTDAGQTSVPVRESRPFKVPVGHSGRLTLAFPNDETNAAYRILVVERLALSGPRTCTSTLARQNQVTSFTKSVTGVVHDLEGLQFRPCQAGRVRLTVSGTRVEGAGPRLRVQQGGRILIDALIGNRTTLQFSVLKDAPVQLSVTNFLGRQVKYRNLFISDLKFTPAP